MPFALPILSHIRQHTISDQAMCPVEIASAVEPLALVRERLG